MATAGVFGSAVAGLSAAVDALLATPLDLVPAGELLSGFAALEAQRNRLAALDQALIAAFATSGAVAESGASSLPGLVASLTRCSRGAARARASAAVDLGPRRAVSGEPLDAIHPVTAAVSSTGAVSAEQAAVIVAACGRLGPDAEPSAFEVVERFLVEAAAVEAPEALRGSANWVLSQVDPGGREPVEAARERARELSFVPARDEIGGTVIRGRLTAECDAVLRAVLDVLAAPRPAEESGERDERTAGQRRHDALLELALRVLRSGDLPDAGGVPASVVVQLHAASCDPLPPVAGQRGPGSATAGSEAADCETTDWGATDCEASDCGAGECGAASSELVAPERSGRPLVALLTGIGWLGDGRAASLERLGALLDNCEVTTVLLDSSGGVLDFGRTRRTASPGQRRALTARDGGCCFPGCDRPASWTEAHHVIPWLEFGETNIANLCLLCSYHHRHFGPAGWRVEIRDGLPTWTPPAWLDPLQRPVRNTARHLPALVFTATEPELIRRT